MKQTLKHRIGRAHRQSIVDAFRQFPIKTKLETKDRFVVENKSKHELQIRKKYGQSIEFGWLYRIETKAGDDSESDLTLRVTRPSVRQYCAADPKSKGFIENFGLIGENVWDREKATTEIGSNRTANSITCEPHW
ncbi:MAG: hypothetical protein AAF939_21970 [Planctomycetota bacterium]